MGITDMLAEVGGKEFYDALTDWSGRAVELHLCYVEGMPGGSFDRNSGVTHVPNPKPVFSRMDACARELELEYQFD